MARKSRRNRRRNRRRSRRRHRRGGMSTNNPAFLKKMNLVVDQAAKTQQAGNAAARALDTARLAEQKLVRKARNVAIPSICKNPFMKDHPKCKKKLTATSQQLKKTSAQAGLVGRRVKALKRKMATGGLKVPHPRQSGRGRSRRRRSSRRRRRSSRRRRRRSRRRR